MSLRSLRSRVDRLIQTQPQLGFAEACICFPANEQPALGLPAEREAVASVLCPLHGKRFTAFRWPPFQSTRPGHWKAMWENNSAQYRRAIAASFPRYRWPAVGLIDNTDTLRFVLKDGSEVGREKLIPFWEEGDMEARTKDGRPIYPAVPNASLIGPPRGTNEVVRITEDDEWRYHD